MYVCVIMVLDSMSPDLASPDVSLRQLKPFRKQDVLESRIQPGLEPEVKSSPDMSLILQFGLTGTTGASKSTFLLLMPRT